MFGSLAVISSLAQPCHASIEAQLLLNVTLIGLAFLRHPLVYEICPAEDSACLFFDDPYHLCSALLQCGLELWPRIPSEVDLFSRHEHRSFVGRVLEAPTASKLIALFELKSCLRG